MAAIGHAVGYHTRRRARHSRVGGIVARRPQQCAGGCGIPSRPLSVRRVKGPMATAINRRESARRRRTARRGEVIACHECGTVHRLPAMADDTIARCTACGAKIFIRFEQSVPRTLALYLAALFLVLVANAFPIMTMSLEGQSNAATILDSAKALYDDGMWPLAIAVALAGMVIPLAKIVGMLAILLPLHLGLRPPWIVAGFRWVERLQPWAMMEVYLLGVIVAYVKLQDLATIHLGVAIYRLRRHHPPPGRRRRALRPARDLAPPRPAGGPGLLEAEARHRAARLRAMRSGGAGGCRPAARPRLPALRHGDPSAQAGQPQSHLGAGAHRGHPLHPGQPAAGADRDLLRPGRAQHHRRRRDRARARRHAARGDSRVLRQHPGARAEADGLGVPPGVHPARMVGAPGRPDTRSTGSSRASGAGRWSTCS